MNGQPKKITRIDLVNLPHKQGTLVEKFQDGWTASSRAVITTTNKEMTFAEIVEWLKANEWLVYEWPACPELGIEQGARAFRGKPLPVRTKNTLIWYRNLLGERFDRAMKDRRDPYTGQLIPLPINLSTIDLALYL
jgi:hypothetical protein